ncbi:30S ribosome-binding factor RbfA [Candidatus Falkowbacteria bacterium]|nr:30S ribosome-binding factor RbfA [Candidatus Falkowbacteria bacterium]
MSRMDQVNELLHQNIALIVNENIKLENGMITVSYVDCSPDLRSAKVAISVLPDNMAGTALKKLRSSSGLIVSLLSKKIKLKKIPRLAWVFDPTEKNAASLDEIFNEIEKEKEENEQKP